MKYYQTTISHTSDYHYGNKYRIEGNIGGEKHWRMTINLPKFDSPIFIST